MKEKIIIQWERLYITIPRGTKGNIVKIYWTKLRLKIQMGKLQTLPHYHVSVFNDFLHYLSLDVLNLRL